MSLFQHHDRRVYPYRSEDLFAMVADVERYPQFLPWCLRVDMLARNDDGFSAVLHVGKAFMSESFTSHDRLFRPGADGGDWKITANSQDGPFRWLRSEWIFRDQADGACVDFSISFDLKSSLFAIALGRFFHTSIARLSLAFEERAHILYR